MINIKSIIAQKFINDLFQKLPFLDSINNNGFIVNKDKHLYLISNKECIDKNLSFGKTIEYIKSKHNDI